MPRQFDRLIGKDESRIVQNALLHLLLLAGLIACDSTSTPESRVCSATAPCPEGYECTATADGGAYRCLNASLDAAQPCSEAALLCADGTCVTPGSDQCCGRSDCPAKPGFYVTQCRAHDCVYRPACTADTFECGNSCIPLDGCCSNADCTITSRNTSVRCADHVCVSECVPGTKACEDGHCAPSNGCCAASDCRDLLNTIATCDTEGRCDYACEEGHTACTDGTGRCVAEEDGCCAASDCPAQTGMVASCTDEGLCTYTCSPGRTLCSDGECRTCCPSSTTSCSTLTPACCATGTCPSLSSCLPTKTPATDLDTPATLFCFPSTCECSEGLHLCPFGTTGVSICRQCCSTAHCNPAPPGRVVSCPPLIGVCQYPCAEGLSEDGNGNCVAAP